MAGRRQIITVAAASDGTQSQWPPKPHRPTDEDHYKLILAKAWVDHLGAAQPGIEYQLDKLPDGFALFEVDLPSQKAKRLFGHQSGRYYDSTAKFKPHFIWLQSGMEGNCQCHLCGGKRMGPVIPRNRGVSSFGLSEKRKPRLSATGRSPELSDSPPGRTPGLSSGRPQRQVRAAGAPYAQDAEGTEDIYKDKLKRLQANSDSRKGIEDDILEPNSIDWRAEHSWSVPNPQDWPGVDLVQRTITAIEHQHSFIPRVGELVLFCPIWLDGHFIMLDEQTQEFKFYTFEQQCFHGFPDWRAGVVAEIPSATAADSPVDFSDIQNLPKKHNSLNTGGFRIETFPDPNDPKDKTASKQYRYLPLRAIRPFSQYQMMLNGIVRSKWHTSIENALTVMTTVSLLDKFDFKGDWPNANVRCKGISIGSELITMGDTVRMMPQKGSNACTDVLIVESIRLHLRGIKPEHVLPDSPLIASHMYITLVGKAYTTDPNRRYNGGLPATVVDPETAKTLFRPVGTILYGTWYPLHADRQRFEISHDQILGRLYEAAAVQLWTSVLQRKLAHTAVQPKPTLNYDLAGIIAGRVYATQADERLDEAENGKLLWYWADTRAEALDLQTLNGIEVGRYDEVRDNATMAMWRDQLRVLNGLPTDSISSKFTNFASLEQVFGKKRGRPAGSKIIDGKLYKPGDPGFDEIAGEPDEDPMPQLTPSKHKTSQMAGAALVSTDESSNDEMTYEDAKERWDVATDGGPAHRSVERSEPPALNHPSPALMEKKQPKSKMEIMASAAASGGGDEYESSEEDIDWNVIPPARGGTDESEGGDYDPRRDDWDD